MKISDNGVALIKKWEGYLAKASNALDGVWTIGFGHTFGVKEGMTCTIEQATEWLKQDIATFEERVNKYQSVYNFNQNQFDALVSFCYNIGNIKQLTNDGKKSIENIAKDMLLYVNCNGKPLQGLVNRRKDEQALFLTPIKTQSQVLDSSCAVKDVSIAGRYRVDTNGSRLMLRKTAEIKDNNIVAKLENKSTVICYGYRYGEWYFVQQNKPNGLTGFAHSDYLTRYANL